MIRATILALVVLLGHPQQHQQHTDSSRIALAGGGCGSHELTW